MDKYVLVVAEKPSVAQSIGKVLGAYKRHDGYLEGSGYIVSWCYGHLAEYATPEAYDERYGRWDFNDLPIVPVQWKLEVDTGKEKQVRVLTSLLSGKLPTVNRENGCESADREISVDDDEDLSRHRFTSVGAGQSSTGGFESLRFALNDGGRTVRCDQDDGISYVVNACDAGREGELIFRHVYELAGAKVPIKRLWISSMEDEAIRDGFSNLKDGKDFENLYAATVCRAKADWLVGMNATRAFTTVYAVRMNVGRVQSPTLSMIVDRQQIYYK